MAQTFPCPNCGEPGTVEVETPLEDYPAFIYFVLVCQHCGGKFVLDRDGNPQPLFPPGQKFTTRNPEVELEVIHTPQGPRFRIRSSVELDLPLPRPKL